MPAKGTAEYDEALQAMERGENDLALTFYDKAIAAGLAISGEFYSNKSTALLNLGKYKNAIKQCKKGLALHGISSELSCKLSLQLATAYASLGLFRDALDAYRQCDQSPEVLAKIAALSKTLGIPVEASEELLVGNRLGSSETRTTGMMESKGSSGDRRNSTSATASNGAASLPPSEKRRARRSTMLSKAELLAKQEQYLLMSGMWTAPSMQLTRDMSRACGYESKASLQNLERVNIADLNLNRVNVGKVLFCRTISQPSWSGSVLAIVEDPVGDATQLTIYNFCTARDYNSALPRGTYVAVKEPWLKLGAYDGVELVRIDKPTDLVFLAPNDPLLAGIKWSSVL